MTSITAQQTKLDLELVPKENRLDIGKCNGRIPRGLKPKEETFQVVLDALALTPCYPAFLITADVPEICPRVPGRDFDALPSEEDTISFLRDLGHTGVINSLNDVVIDQMHQPWRTFAAIINRSLSGKTSGLDKLRLSRAQILWGMYHQKNVDYVELLWEDFTYQIDNKVYKKQEKMYYPRFTKVIIHHFLIQEKSLSWRNRIRMHTSKDDYLINTLRFVSRRESLGGNDEDDNNNEQESSDESNKKENESEKQELDSEQDEESDDDDQEEEEIDQENGSEDDEMKCDEEQGRNDTTDQFDDDVDARLEEPTETATGIIQALEKEVDDLKKDPLHTKVTSLVDSHLDTRLGETIQEFMNFLSESLTARIKEQVKVQLPQILPHDVSNFASHMIEKLIKELRDEVTIAKASSQPQSTFEDASTLTEFELKKILLDKMEKNFFYSYDEYSLKRSRKDKDKDEDPSAGSDRRLKKRKISKDAEPTTESKKKDSTSGSSKGTKSQPKSTRKSVQ
ncbi:hypothetical protein Tco_0818649 [Tanacetum coccineum]